MTRLPRRAWRLSALGPLLAAGWLGAAQAQPAGGGSLAEALTAWTSCGRNSANVGRGCSASWATT